MSIRNLFLDNGIVLPMSTAEWNALTTNENVEGENVAIGLNAGENNQGLAAIAIGFSAGQNNQGTNSIAIGNSTCQAKQGVGAVAIGYDTAQTGQPDNCISIGPSASAGHVLNESTASIAIGQRAGYDYQGLQCIAMGYEAGYTSQGNYSIAIGLNAGQNSQDEQCIAIGNDAGQNNQYEGSVAIGADAGRYDQGTYSVAVGPLAGCTGLGGYSVAIGYLAGETGQQNNSIVLNASGNFLTAPNSGFFANPLRNVTSSYSNSSISISNSVYVNGVTYENNELLIDIPVIPSFNGVAGDLNDHPAIIPNPKVGMLLMDQGGNIVVYKGGENGWK